MGWWGANEGGDSLQPNGSLTWGDGPADIIDNALDEIDKEFEQAWGRKPTLAELQSGLLFSARVRYDGNEGDLAARVVELETALHRWGRHERDCTALDPGGSCSCGLTPFAYPEAAR